MVSELDEINIYSLDWQKMVPGVVKEGMPLKLIVLRKVDTEDKIENQIFTLKDGNNY